MIVVLKSGVDAAGIADLESLIRRHGCEPRRIEGVERAVIAVLGEIKFDPRDLEGHPAAMEVLRVGKPYKLASREARRERTVVRVGGVEIGGEAVVLMAGPCAVESREMLLETADRLRELGVGILRGGAFKPRTSPYSFQGLGEEGLRWLADARERTGMPVVTEVTSPEKVELVARYADILQIGARNMQNFDLLRTVAEVDKPVLLKRGLSATIDEWLMAAEYVLSRGVNTRVILCERGIRTFENQTRNTLDLNALPVLRKLTHLPVIVDPSHATGVREYVMPMALAGIAGGADGLMIEVHPDPDKALSDGPQSLTPGMLAKLMRGVQAVAPVVGRVLRRHVAAPAVPARGAASETVAFQGEAGAFSERAARAHFGSDVPTLPCVSFRDAFQAAADGRARAAVLPLENTITGTVNPNLDLLLESGLRIVGEVKLRVEHFLIANPGVPLDRVRTVYAHPQAALQCERTLRERGWEVRLDYDTAGSVRRLKEERLQDAAAIAGRQAAELHDMRILLEGIESTPQNYTRFAVVAREAPVPANSDKTSIAFATRHEPGALARALTLLSDRKINLSKLESRPIPDRPWEYLFFADLEGSWADPRIAEALEALAGICERFHWLGSYAAA
jgi:3-deoxy-7-phosphoheptulonate synthase